MASGEIGEVMAAGKRSHGRRQADRDGDVTSLDDFRIRCGAPPPPSRPVTNGTISQHPVSHPMPAALVALVHGR